MMTDCSNCTFMELKFDGEHGNKREVLSSNCTFMELKFQKMNE